MTSKPIHPNPPRWQPNPDPASIVVPGLDTSASMLDQIEQMEQLITIKLQNVDENFSKIHNVLATRILPAVKRYAAATKPVREAANFWVSFYEQAAQIRIPTYDDYSTVNEVPSERDDLASEAEYSSRVADRTAQHGHGEQSVAATENSFMPPHAAFTSSTPAMSRVGHSMEDTFAGDHSGAPSWSASLESPLTRLDREVQNFTREDSAHSSKLPPLHLGEPPVEQEEETVMLPRIDNRKGKGKVLAEPLLQSVLRHTLYSTTDDVSLSAHSPTKGKLKTPVPAGLNPYLPQDTEPANWSGLVDLRRTPLSTPQRKKNPTDSDDDSFDGLPPGMSPPVLMSPARPPRSTAELQLLRGKTPAKEAAARIKNDLVREAQRQNSAKSRRMHGYPTSGGESSLSTVASPPSLSRYNKLDTDDSAVDTSLESVMHRVALDPPTWTPRGNTPALRLRPKSTFVRPDSQSAPTYLAPPTHPQFPAGQYEPLANEFGLPAATPLRYDAELGDDGFDSDSDSLDDEVNNTAHPSAAFLMAQAASSSFDDDDSFQSQDSLDQADAGALALEGIVDVHPFALARGGFVNAADNSFDESFDDGGLPREETVFGRPPAQAQRAQASRLSARGELLMYGDEASVVPDTMQYGMAASSPTPHWSGGSRD